MPYKDQRPDTDEATAIASPCRTVMAASGLALSGEQRSTDYQEPRGNHEHTLDVCKNGINPRPSSTAVPVEDVDSGGREMEIGKEGSQAAPIHWTWFHVRNLVLLATCFALGWAAVFVQVGRCNHMMTSGCSHLKGMCGH